MCRSASAPFSAPSERGCRKGRWLAQQRRAPTPRRAAAGIVARAHASASRGKDPRGRSGAPWPRGGQPLGPRRAHSTARADKPRTTARDWARCRVFLSQHATDRLVTVLLVLLFASRFQSSFRFQSSALQSKGITASCGARHLNNSFTFFFRPPAPQQPLRSLRDISVCCPPAPPQPLRSLRVIFFRHPPPPQPLLRSVSCFSPPLRHPISGWRCVCVVLVLSFLLTGALCISLSLAGKCCFLSFFLSD